MFNAASIATVLFMAAYLCQSGHGSEFSAMEIALLVSALVTSIVGGLLAIRERQYQRAALFLLSGIAFDLSALIERLTNEDWSNIVSGALLVTALAFSFGSARLNTVTADAG